MNTDIKRHIDAARQVLVGVVPNPTSQIDQITNALIYKFMDDMDQAAMRAGGEVAFFVGDLERYSWTRLMDPRMGNQERMNLYGEALLKFSESKQLPELFRDIFKSAILPYRSPEVLGLFLKEVAYFDYSHPEDLGDAYEYLLSIMSSQGDAGQFRTPRHIIDFIVDVVNPSKDDRVLDPACGTGGFLVSSYKHILEQHDGKNPDGTPNSEKSLTPSDRQVLMKNFEGYDIDPGMVRIAQVNMYLHQFRNPRIYQYDTLSMDERWNEKYDVILANPPFMSPKGGVKTHSKFSIPSSRSEVLFVDYIMNHLRPRGRAGIIVPEGIIFQSGTAHKQLRKNLVEDGLYAVVSLPSGVFAPYSGVKTSILLFDNELAKQKQEILFVKVENDGYDLGATKRPISKNDLPGALEILKGWRAGSVSPAEAGIPCLAVPRIQIAENGDYNLSGDRYRVATDYSNTKWPMVNMGDERYFKIESGGTPESTNPDFWNGTINWATLVDLPAHNLITLITDTQRKITNRGLAHSSAKLLPKGTVIISSRATIGRVAICGCETATNQGFKNVVVNNNCVDSKYIANVLTSLKAVMEALASGGTFKEISKSNFETIKIPLPPLEVQQQIVAELDGYQSIISGARQVVENWKAKIEIDPTWERMKLGDVCEIRTGKKDVNQGNASGQYPFFTCAKEHTYSDSYSFDTEALLIAGNGDVGAIKHYKGKFEAYQRTYVLSNFCEKSLPMFLFFYLDTTLKPVVSVQKLGNTMPYIKLGMLTDFEIPLPPLVTQQQIVARIEAERTLVEGNRRLIEIYEQKVKQTIAKLWEE